MAGVTRVPLSTCHFGLESILNCLQAVDVNGVCLCENNTGVGHDWFDISCVQFRAVHQVVKADTAVQFEEKSRMTYTRTFIYRPWLSNCHKCS